MRKRLLVALLGFAGFFSALPSESAVQYSVTHQTNNVTDIVTLQSSSCTISSERFKDHVVDFLSSALSVVDGLDVVSFNMKPREKPNPDPNFGTRQVGLTAENVAQAAPECAIYENDMKTPKSYRQECVIALLVKSVQELSGKVAVQRAELKRLRH